MQASVLVPQPHAMHDVRAVRRHAAPGVHLEGVPRSVLRPTLDRVRAAIRNAGLALPSGSVDVRIDPPIDRGGDAELAIALAILLADPAHHSFRRIGYVALGTLTLGGRLRECVAPRYAGLPGGAWLGRIWDPPDRIPARDEDALLTIVDVDTLFEAWDSLVRLIELEPAIREATSARLT